MRIILPAVVFCNFVAILSEGQCTLELYSSDSKSPLVEIAVYVHTEREGEVVYATVTDSNGRFTIPEELCVDNDSVYLSLGTLRKSSWERLGVSCCLNRKIYVPPSYLAVSLHEGIVEVKFSGSANRVNLPEPLSTGHASAVEVPARIQSLDPLALMSRKSGWDVNISIEGMDSRRVRARMEGSSLYSLCPMEMGGCLAGLQSFLTDNLEIDYSTPLSGGTLLDFSIASARFERIPSLDVVAFGRASTLGNGYEAGLKGVFSSPRWFATTGFAYSYADSYYAGNKTIVPNSDYRNIGAMFKLAHKWKKLSPEFSYFLSRTTDAGYPTFQNVRIKNEERHVVALKDRIYSNKLSIDYSFAYQSGIHLMEMENTPMGDLLSGANSKIYDGEVSIFRNSFRNIKLGFTSSATLWQMDAFLYPQSNPDQLRDQIKDALTLEWLNSVVVNWKRLEFTIGGAYMHWTAKDRKQYRYFIPVGISRFHSFLFRDKLYLRLEAEHSYRIPTPVELYREHVVLPGGKYLLSFADSLLPERLWGARVTMRWTYRNWETQSELGLSLQGFVRLIENYIFLKDFPNVPSPLPSVAPIVVAYQNIGNLLLSGAGLKLDYANRRLENELLVGWTWGQFLNDGSPAPYIFPFSVRASVKYSFIENLKAVMSVEGMPAQNRVNPALGQVPSPAFVKIDFAIHSRIASIIDVSLFVNNITDQYYFLPTSYGAVPEPGRFFGISVKLNLNKAFISGKNVMVAEFKVPMQCSRCARTVRKILYRQSGIIKVEADYDEDIVKVWFDYFVQNPEHVKMQLEKEYGERPRLIKVRVIEK